MVEKREAGRGKREAVSADGFHHQIQVEQR